MTGRVTVVGSINTDLVSVVPRLPGPGETVLGEDLIQLPGGKGANQAVAAARQGSRLSFVGRIGDDDFGQSALANLTAEGIDTRHVTIDAMAPSGVALILVDGSGENSIAVASGANARISAADVRAAAEVITSADCLLLQLEIPLEAVIEAARIAREAGVRIVLNPAPAGSLPKDLLVQIDYLTPNESELRTLIGEMAEDDTGLVELGRQIRGSVIQTRGERGLVYTTESGDLAELPGHPVAACDTTGAGDTFNGVLAAGLAHGLPFVQALTRANAAAAIAVTGQGAQAAMPSMAQVVEFLSRG